MKMITEFTHVTVNLMQEDYLIIFDNVNDVFLENKFVHTIKKSVAELLSITHMINVIINILLRFNITLLRKYFADSSNNLIHSRINKGENENFKNISINLVMKDFFTPLQKSYHLNLTYKHLLTDLLNWC